MNRTWSLLLIGCLTLAGCAVAPQQESAHESYDSYHGSSLEELAPPVDESLPAAELNPALLYQLLVGEVAAQRGELEMSAHAYQQTAAATRDPRLARRAAQVAIFARDYTTALKAARLWVELTPASLEANQSLAALLIRQGRADESLAVLERLLALAPKGEAQGYMLVSNILAREQDKRRALEVMEALTAQRGEDVNALFAHANLAYVSEEHELALRLSERLLVLQPGLTRALVLKASTLRRLGRTGEGLAVYRQAVEATPDDAGLRMSYARVLVDEQRLAEAREQFRLLGRQQPNNGDVIYAEGLLALQAGDTAQAEEYFRRLIKLGQRRDEAAFALGQIAESRDDGEAALGWYRQVGEGNNYIDAAIRSAVLIKRRDGAEAARAFLQQVEPYSSEHALRLVLAEAELLRDAGAHAEAMAVYDAGLTQFPGNIELLYARAMNAERMERLDLLERDLRAILAQDANNVQALNALGYTLADRTNRYKEAHELVRRAYEQRPEDPAIIDSMGWVMYRLGRMDEAEQLLRQALERHYDAEIAAHLGEVLWQRGRHDEARAVWQEALKRSPEHPLLRQVIERFSQ